MVSGGQVVWWGGGRNLVLLYSLYSAILLEDGEPEVQGLAVQASDYGLSQASWSTGIPEST